MNFDRAWEQQEWHSEFGLQQQHQLSVPDRYSNINKHSTGCDLLLEKGADSFMLFCNSGSLHH